MRPVDAAGEVIIFPPLHEHHVHVGVSPCGVKEPPADTQMLSKNGDFSEYTQASLYDFAPYHVAIGGDEMLNVDAFLWDVRPENSSALYWFYEIAVRVDAPPMSARVVAPTNATTKMATNATTVTPPSIATPAVEAATSGGDAGAGGVAALEGGALSKWKWPTIITGVPTRGAPESAFYTAEMPFGGEMVLPTLAHFHMHGQELVEGVAYDRLSRVDCDPAGFRFERGTTLTSFTFDGPSRPSWWYWHLKKHMRERAYTHHTWFLYLRADDGVSHFPTYGSYQENRCKSQPGWPP